MLYALILSVIVGDPETGPIHTFVVDYNLTSEDCLNALDQNQNIWLGNNNVGLYCEVQDQ